MRPVERAQRGADDRQRDGEVGHGGGDGKFRGERVERR